MKNMDEIIENIKDIISKEVDGKVLDRHVAEALGMHYTNLMTHKHRNRIPYESLAIFCAKRCLCINTMLFCQSPESLVKNTNDSFFKDAA